MKRFLSILLVVFSVAVSSNSFAQTGWVKQSIDSKIAVKFPKTPEVKEAGPAKLFILAGDDSTKYTANVMDFESLFGMDSATLSGMAPTEEFAEQLKTGMTAQAPGFEVSKLDIGKWKDYTAYTIEGEIAAKKMKMYIKCIFIGSKMYSVNCATAPTSDMKNKDAFFDSIELL